MSGSGDPYREPGTVRTKHEPTVEELFQLLDQLTGWGGGTCSVKVQYVPPQTEGRPEGFHVSTTVCFTPQLSAESKGPTLPRALESLAYRVVAALRQHGDHATRKAIAAEAVLSEWKPQS